MVKLVVRFVAVLFFMGIVYPWERSGAETALFRDLVQKAKAEGRVELWDSINKDSAEKILSVFSKRFGIEAAFKHWRGTGRQQRTLLELRSGRPVSADILSPGREAQEQFFESGVFEMPPYDYLKVWPEIDSRTYDAETRTLYTSGNPRAIAYNPELVPPELVPKTWDDCTRPEFKGRVVLDSRHKLYGLHWHKREWFLDWTRRMVANDVKVMRGQSQVLQLVAAGAYAVFCGSNANTIQRLINQGAETLNIAVPGELLVEVANASYIRKGSPNPHAAQLLLGWFAGEEAQRLIDEIDYKAFPWTKGTFVGKLAEGNKVLLCDVECAKKAGDMSREYVQALGLPAK